MKGKAIIVALPILLGAGLCMMMLARSSTASSARQYAPASSPRIPATAASYRSPLAPGEIDLLEHVRTDEDAVAGPWTLQGGSLLSPAVQWGRLSIPCVPPEEYDLRITATRRQGTDSLNIGIVYGGRQGMVMIDGNGGETSWIDLLSPYDLTSNETATLGKYLKWNQPAKIVISVRKGSVAVTIGTEKVIDWKGDPADLKLITGYRVPHRRTLFIGSWETVVQIDEFVLTPVTGTPQFLH